MLWLMMPPSCPTFAALNPGSLSLPTSYVLDACSQTIAAGVITPVRAAGFYR